MNVSTADLKVRDRIMKMMHLGVVILSLLLITLITLDTLRNVSFLADTTYLKVQFWCCLFFMADVFVEMLFSVKKRKYLINHLFFLLVSVPYLNILHYFDIPLDNHAEYLLKFVPMIRAAYVFTIVTGATTSSKLVKNMLATYLIVLIVGVYFCSLTFFVAENGVNPGVTDYWSSLLWSIMSLTTAGCSIHAMTVTGRVLGVVLSAVGLIFFPIFTVFLTNSYTSEQDAGGTTSDKQG
ncbi:MAG: two pore domain potassium channel family protein [Duncaniella muris]|uniref:two pore domain potassium channel family protein n=1 Tax=Duncaniella muris TaxID=2094150 RepID=UPI003568065A